MQEIGSGKNHRVAVDTSKNRVYFWFFGDAITVENVDRLPRDATTARDMLKPGFTILADFTEMKLLGLTDQVTAVQAIFGVADLHKVAEVWPIESFAKFVVNSLAQKVKDTAFAQKIRAFKNRAEAEAWLDE
jgi:hypothetical protein